MYVPHFWEQRGAQTLALPGALVLSGCPARLGLGLSSGAWPSCAGGRGGSGIAGARVPSWARPWSQAESVGPRPQTIWRFPQAYASTQAVWQWWQAPAFPLAAAKLAAGLYPHGAPPGLPARLLLAPSRVGLVSGSVQGALSSPRSEAEALGPDWHEVGRQQCDDWSKRVCCPGVCG